MRNGEEAVDVETVGGVTGEIRRIGIVAGIGLELVEVRIIRTRTEIGNGELIKSRSGSGGGRVLVKRWREF